MRNSATDSVPVVLAIGGFDPSGGAGITSDVRVIQSLGCWPYSVCTILTAQNQYGIHAQIATPADQLAESLRSLARLRPPQAVKIGAVYDAEQAIEIGKFVQPLGIPVVWDPVFRASKGGLLSHPDLLLPERQMAVAKALGPITLLTPNASEWTSWQLPLPVESQLQSIGRELLRSTEILRTHMKITAVLATGGDGKFGTAQSPIVDWLLTEDAWPIVHEPLKPMQGVSSHGTGCRLSSALASYLAHGFSLKEAVEKAEIWMQKALRNPFFMTEDWFSPSTTLPS